MKKSSKKVFSDFTYRPLPEGLTIKDSVTHGLGLHSTTKLEAGNVLGETHVLVHNRDRHEWVRTPLGGFINHSQTKATEIYTLLFQLLKVKNSQFTIVSKDTMA